MLLEIGCNGNADGVVVTSGCAGNADGVAGNRRLFLLAACVEEGVSFGIDRLEEH